MKQPMFSIIIPALNEECFLPNLLSSLAIQTERDFEVIVVDGKSKDKTVAIAKTFAKQLPKLTVIVADHASLPHQRNCGAAKAHGKWLVFIDADTVIFPHTIARLTVYVKNHAPEFFTTWFTPDSDVSNDAVLALVVTLFYEWSKMLKRSVSPGPFTGVRHDVFDAVGGYDVEHPFLEDQDFSQRMNTHGATLHLIRETLYVWSLRRYRKQGTLKVLQSYAKAVVPIVLFRKTPKNMKGYVMGGHVFTKKSSVKKPILKKAEQTLKKLMKELFE